MFHPERNLRNRFHNFESSLDSEFFRFAKVSVAMVSRTVMVWKAQSLHFEDMAVSAMVSIGIAMAAATTAARRRKQG